MPIEISPVHRNLLIEEVLVQTYLAIEAYNRLRETVANENTRQRREVWAYVQSALSHTTMISKYMNPNSNSALSKARASVLKASLEVVEASPIFSRNARNNVEHLDERIDLWIETGPERMLESVFVSRENYEFLNRSEEELRGWFIKRVYLIDEDTFISQGKNGLEEIDLAALMNEVRRIEQTAVRVLSEDSTVTRVYPNLT
ncbi:hypothetical protein [Octadecabacter arcticus]|uniref:hypothetical protein n=1 Tax=Octadecabacter arcticus TaxID=53946 RepID=UPI0005C6BE30|nr:hypothetical protein [Octadecabacter arcticus]